MIKFDDKQLNNIVEQDGDKHFFIETWGRSKEELKDV